MLQKAENFKDGCVCVCVCVRERERERERQKNLEEGNFGERLHMRLEKERATHSSTLAWEIPQTEEPGRLQSCQGSQRLWHDRASNIWKSQRSFQVSKTNELHCIFFYKIEIIFVFRWIVSVSAKLLQSYPTLCSPMHHSLRGFPVHGILQARMLEWVAMPSSRGYSQPRDQTHLS